MSHTIEETRRRFMAHFAGIGLGSTLVPGIVWARMQDQGASRITAAMVKDALLLQGVEVPDADIQAMVASANNNLTGFEQVRKMSIPLDVSPPFHFSALAPGIEPNRTKMPFRMSLAPVVKRPSNLEDVAFWPVRHLAELVRTRQVTSRELTEMYLARLHKYNPKLNFVVTFLDDLAMAQAKQADTEIAAGKYKGPLHGIPWGAKDIISVKGYKTTWGAAPLKDQMFDYDASVVEQLREAGAVLVAKLSTGELAQGDQWFGGRTNSPWDPAQGSGGSSAGSSSATAAGCVAFALGSETSGSILSPAARCGIPSLRPTFGRVSRYGIMALSWTLDRIGPMVRYAEDAAIVMQAIARLDGRDMSVSDIPWNWDARLDIKKLRVGYIKESFDSLTNDSKANGERLLETLRGLGVSKFIEMKIPESQAGGGGSSLGTESFVYFDDMRRAGKLTGSRMGNANRPTARLLPAVEYLQQQRLRMMMMTELAAATKDVDVYLVASNAGGGGGGRAGGRAGDPDPAATTTGAAGAAGAGAAGTAGAAGAAGRGGDPAGRGGAAGAPGGGRGGPGGGGGGPAQRHSTMANSACYPAMNVPNGFTAAGSPTNVTFFARPFGEMELIALAKAYQDVAKHHLVKPTKMNE